MRLFDRLFGRIIYRYCNIYNGTILGRRVKIGAYTELSGAVIGNDVTIGAKCFIPKGVRICSGAWIGPGVHFTHSFPPTTSKDWKPAIVEEGAMIGSNATIKEGIIIGAGAKVGCGSVVTKSIPAGEIWAGNPAKKLKEDE